MITGQPFCIFHLPSGGDDDVTVDGALLLSHTELQLLALLARTLLEQKGALRSPWRRQEPVHLQPHQVSSI